MNIVSNLVLLRNRGLFRQRPIFQNFTQCSPMVSRSSRLRSVAETV